VIGDGLRSRTDGRRATEVDVAVHVLNRMLELDDGKDSFHAFTQALAMTASVGGPRQACRFAP
jgi:hypothetical protein